MILLNSKAFTLTELLLGITIMSLIILGGTKLDYNRLSKIQKLEIFLNNIKSNFETIRNNSLIGKGIGNGLDVPSKWTIEYSTSNSGTIISTAYDNSSNILISEKIKFEYGTIISKIRCLQYNGTEKNILTNSETGSIDIIGNKIEISTIGDCSDNTNILELSIQNTVSNGIIQINLLNGLVEIK